LYYLHCQFSFNRLFPEETIVSSFLWTTNHCKNSSISLRNETRQKR